MRPFMSFSLSSSAGIRALLQVRSARGTIESVIIEAQPEGVRLPAKIPSERVKATNLKFPFSFALVFSLASSLRPDPSDTKEARR